MKSLSLVAAGGMLGSVARFAIGEWMQPKVGGAFPWATLAVNLAGCLLVGMAIGVMSKYEVAATNLRLFVVVGFCGGFTTFSAFSRELFQMLSCSRYTCAAIYALVSVGVGLLLTCVGYVMLKS